MWLRMSLSSSHLLSILKCRLRIRSVLRPTFFCSSFPYSYILHKCSQTSPLLFAAARYLSSKKTVARFLLSYFESPQRTAWPLPLKACYLQKANAGLRRCSAELGEVENTVTWDVSQTLLCNNWTRMSFDSCFTCTLASISDGLSSQGRE